MTCEEAWLLINGHLDGENTQAEEAQLRDHLKGCSQCRELLQLLQDGDAAILSLEEEAPADLSRNVMQAIRQEAAPRKRLWQKWAGLAVAAALVLTIGLTAMPQKAEDAPVEAVVMTARSMPQAAFYAAGTEMAQESSELQTLADTRAAAIVVLERPVEELEACACERLDSGEQLYSLPDGEMLRNLADRYDLQLVLPSDGSEPEAFYAYLAS